MDFLQSLLDNSSIPAITAFILGLLTAVSRIFHSKMQFGVELALLRTPPPLQGGREEQVASCRDEKRDDALTVPLRLMQYICC